MLLGVGDGTKPNTRGDRPWASVDPLTPNEAYFKNVDDVLRIAGENNVVISLTLYHQRWRKLITERTRRNWAKWLAQRYKSVPNVVWAVTPEAKPEYVPVLRELAAGLREGDHGAHLISLRARSRALFLQLHPRRDLARLQFHSDLEKRRAHLPVRDERLQPQTREARADGAREPMNMALSIDSM